LPARIATFGNAVNMLVAILMVRLANRPFMNWLGNQTGEGYEDDLLALATPIMIRVAGAFSVDGALAAKGEGT
jgi:uncharacterized membrane protein YphA (DoxX/SURF4 family)